MPISPDLKGQAGKRRGEMTQIIEFDTTPTANPNETAKWARSVVNADSGIGMDVLKKVIEEHIPSVSIDNCITRKIVIRTDRYECPCCQLMITALVEVNGGYTLVDQKPDPGYAFYWVNIWSNRNGRSSEVRIKKLVGGEDVFRGEVPYYMARKDYSHHKY